MSFSKSKVFATFFAAAAVAGTGVYFAQDEERAAEKNREQGSVAINFSEPQKVDEPYLEGAVQVDGIVPVEQPLSVERPVPIYEIPADMLERLNIAAQSNVLVQAFIDEFLYLESFEAHKYIDNYVNEYGAESEFLEAAEILLEQGNIINLNSDILAGMSLMLSRIRADAYEDAKMDIITSDGEFDIYIKNFLAMHPDQTDAYERLKYIYSDDVSSGILTDAQYRNLRIFENLRYAKGEPEEYHDLFKYPGELKKKADDLNDVIEHELDCIRMDYLEGSEEDLQVLEDFAFVPECH